MTDIIWEFAEDLPSEIAPYTILKEFGLQLGPDTKGIFNADIVQTIKDDGSMVCSFYLVVPQLSNYSYKLMEMVQPKFFKFYPVKMSLFGKAEGNVITDVATNPTEFRAKVAAFIANPLTKLILTALRTQIEIYNDFK